MSQKKFKFGAKSKKELLHVHPDLVMVVELALSLSTVDFAVTDGLRELEEQKELVRRGVSRTLKSRHMVGQDGWGHAVDLVPYVNGKVRWEWEPIYEVAKAMHAALTEYENITPIRWGGVWDRRLIKLDGNDLKGEVEAYAARRRDKGYRVFLDGPHFEIPNIKGYR